MPDGRVFIGDASSEQGCRRGVDPARSGMLISRTGTTEHKQQPDRYDRTQTLAGQVRQNTNSSRTGATEHKHQ